MVEHKCDKCGKAITERKTAVLAGIGYFANREFCAPCGKPIAKILKKLTIKK